MSKTGTREWAEHNRNIQLGCENDCRYCYAREMAVRFKRATADSWKHIIFDRKRIVEKPRLLNGRIMFPTTHDITQANMKIVATYLIGWLKAGNEILIVSKPDPVCIAYLCEQLAPYKSQITFRFTIGSTQDDVLSFWEPHAPRFAMRMASLKIAFQAGFATSVSAEPFLDNSIIQLVVKVLPYVTDVVWIGKMNRIENRVILNRQSTEDLYYLGLVKECQGDDEIKLLYSELKSNRFVKWKDSIKSVIGLSEEAIG